MRGSTRVPGDDGGGPGLGLANGVWGRPVPMPGLAALNKGGSAGVGALSCPRPGACAAGGSYTGRSGHLQGWVTQGQIAPLRPVR